MSQATPRPTSHNHQTTNPPLTPLELLNTLHHANAHLTLTPDREHLTLDAPTGTLTPQIRASLNLHKLALIALLRGDPIIPRLPWELENLIRQANTAVPLKGPEGVGDASRYVLSWAASYALGDRQHVLETLWAVWRLNHPDEQTEEQKAA